jgi:hypothetical protein
MEEKSMKARIFAMEVLPNGEGKISLEVDVVSIEAWKKQWIKSNEVDVQIYLKED